MQRAWVYWSNWHYHASKDVKAAWPHFIIFWRDNVWSKTGVPLLQGKMAQGMSKEKLAKMYKDIPWFTP